MYTMTVGMRGRGKTYVFLVPMLLLAIPAAAQQNVAGSIVTRQGKTINFTGIAQNNRLLSFEYGPEDKVTTVTFADVSEITFGEKSTVARIRLKDGRDIDARGLNGRPQWEPGLPNESTHMWSFDFSYFDDVARKLQSSSIEYTSATRITFDMQVGRFRRCPHCNALWADSYLFCPHDGVRTVWGEASGSLTTAGAAVTVEEIARRRACVMEAVLNASLARSGIDPHSKDAERAKEFGLLWMNPLADPKDIQRKLDEIRAEFIQQGNQQ